MLDDLETVFARIIAETKRDPVFNGQGAYDSASSSSYHEDLLSVSVVLLPHALKRILEWPSAPFFLPDSVLAIRVRETDAEGIYAVEDTQIDKFAQYVLGLSLSYLVDQVAKQSPQGTLDLGILTRPMTPGWLLHLAEVAKNESSSEAIHAADEFGHSLR